MLILVLAALGLLLLVIGVLSVRYVFKAQRTGHIPPRWGVLRAVVIGTSLSLAPISLFARYPYRDSEGKLGHVIGLPFLAAYFDSAGHDYVGGITLFATVGNAVVWLLIPWILLAVYVRLSQRNTVGA